MRQKATNAVSKFMNNTLFGKLCSKVAGRKDHSIIFEKERAAYLYDMQCSAEGRRNKWKDTPEFNELQALEEYQERMLQLNKAEHLKEADVELRRETCREKLDEKLHLVDQQKQKRYQWRGKYKNQVEPRTSLAQLADVMKDPYTSQLNGEHNSAIEYESG